MPREMTDAEIDIKHERLRGSLDYRYPPLWMACRFACSLNDKPAERNGNWTDHICVLAKTHEGAHQWSSECGQMRSAVV